MNFQEVLREHSEASYRDFTAKLIPTASPERILGVRVPRLRAIASALWRERNEACRNFLREVPHVFLEENHLHSLFLCKLTDPKETLEQVEAFLPQLDNWATCDILRPKSVKKNLPLTREYLRAWLQHDHPYAVRLAIGFYHGYFLEEAFQTADLAIISQIRSEHYYVRMMVAWYFAEALVRQPEATWRYFEQPHLDPWTHNKAIQKARESRRISPADRERLATLRRRKEDETHR